MEEYPEDEVMRRFRSSISASSSPQFGHFFGGRSEDQFLDFQRRPPGIPRVPPISPYSQISSTSGSPAQQFGPLSRTISLSQPSTFFSVNSLPPLIPSPRRESPVSGSSSDQLTVDFSANLSTRSSDPDSADLPPRKLHRRSYSAMPLGFFQSSFSALSPSSSQRAEGFTESGSVKDENSLDQSIRKNAGLTARKQKEDAEDDLIYSYMNLDRLDARIGEIHGAEGSGDESDGSDNESGNLSSEKREGIKRRAIPDTDHSRSISFESSNTSLDKIAMSFDSELESGEFNEVDFKKILSSERLAEIVSTDPKRARRILANRQSAARSKERKTRYISELEYRVQKLQTEATVLSAQLTIFQRDSASLGGQNQELALRLQAMERQACLRDALNEALTLEVRRLTIANRELSGESAT